MKICPACGRPLNDHPQQDIGSAVIGSEDDERLSSRIAKGDWLAARRFQSANALADVRVWRRIHCPDERVGIISLIMPIELYSDEQYEEARFPSNEELGDLLPGGAKQTPEIQR